MGIVEVSVIADLGLAPYSPISLIWVLTLKAAGLGVILC